MERIIRASEFTRNFGRYQMLAQREPIAVTSHGRTTGYFIAAEDYEAFKRFQQRSLGANPGLTHNTGPNT